MLNLAPSPHLCDNSTVEDHYLGAVALDRTLVVECIKMSSTDPILDFRQNRLLFLTVPVTFLLGLGGALIAFMVYRRAQQRLQGLSDAINNASPNADQAILRSYQAEWQRMDAKAKLAWKHVWIGLFGIPLGLVMTMASGGGRKPTHEDQSSWTVKPSSAYERRSNSDNK